MSAGYEGRDLDSFVQALIKQRVDVLLDVRENAVSRKPGFGKRKLDEALTAAGIEYKHEPLLGNPKDNRAAFRTGVTAVGRSRYLAHLNNGSRHAFEEFVEMALTRRVALLCFEHDENTCHRRCIIEQAQEEVPALSATRLH